MPLQVKCPGCGLTLGVPDGAAGKTVRCAKCAKAFLVPGRPAAPAASPPQAGPTAGARARPDDRVRKAAPRPVPLSSRPKEDEKPVPRRPLRPPERAGKRGGAPLGLLLGGGVAALLLLAAGGAGLWWALRPAEATEKQAEGVPVAQGPAQARPAGPAAEGARPAPPGEPGALPAVPAGDGGEEFVDLPERQEGLPAVAGLVGGEKQPPAPGPGPQEGLGAVPRVVLFNGEAARVRGKAGMFFRVAYRFEQGTPAGSGSRYVWIVQTGKGHAFRQLLTAAELRAQGALQGRALGAVWFDTPYRTYLAVETLVPGRGWQEQRISDVLMIR